MNKKILSIVLSFRNEEHNLSELISRITKSLSGIREIDYEMIFVNDASTDGSRAILEKSAENDKRIKIINMSRRFGNPACIIAGMRYSKGDAVINMDTDLQDPPEVIPAMVEKWLAGADVVYTTRLSRVGESRLKMFMTKCAYRFLRLLAEDVDMPVDSGDFKLVNRRVLNELLSLGEREPFLRGLIHWIGFDQRQVLYHREKRHAGKTHYSLLKNINPYKEFVRGITSFSYLPLYISIILGFVVSFVALLFPVCVMAVRMFGVVPSGYSPLTAGLFFLGGTILFSVGVLSIYIGRIYDQVKGRPMYIVSSTRGFDQDAPYGNVPKRAV